MKKRLFGEMGGLRKWIMLMFCLVVGGGGFGEFLSDEVVEEGLCVGGGVGFGDVGVCCGVLWVGFGEVGEFFIYCVGDDVFVVFGVYGGDVVFLEVLEDVVECVGEVLWGLVECEGGEGFGFYFYVGGSGGGGGGFFEGVVGFEVGLDLGVECLVEGGEVFCFFVFDVVGGYFGVDFEEGGLVGGEVVFLEEDDVVFFGGDGVGGEVVFV